MKNSIYFISVEFDYRKYRIKFFGLEDVLEVVVKDIEDIIKILLKVN